MPPTLKQVETLSSKICLNRKKAAELMEKSGGDLLQALAILEKKGKIIVSSPLKGRSIWSTILQKNGEMKIRVKRPGGILFRIPFVIGILGATAFPRLASFSMLGLLLARCSLKMD